MADAIETLSTATAPYGIEQTQYRLRGSDETLSFDTLIIAVALRQSSAAEAALKTQVTAIQQRQEELESLGSALSICAEVMYAQDGKDTKTSDTLSHAAFGTVRDLLLIYDIPEADAFTYNADTACYEITYADLRLLYEELSYAIERENSTVQSDLVDLQQFLDKRDNAFEQAAALSKKVRDPMSTTLKHI